MFAASKTDSASTGGYQISRSLRFNEPDSTYLNRGVTSTGNRRTYTFSAWVKRSKTGTDSDTIIASMPSGGQFRIFFETSTYPNQLRLFSFDGSFQFQLITTQVFRDFSAWGHLVVAIDTTQATASNRVRVYWNGAEITSFGTSTYPSLNADLQFNQSGQPHSIGGTYNGSSVSGLYNGYITEFNFIDGQALTPSSFGETNAQTGVWQPKAYSGSYGTNGFYLNFSDNSNTTAATLGKDYSGNGNNWTPNNFSVTAGAGNDSLVDSPTSYGTTDTGVGGEIRGNYCTLNPLYKNGAGTPAITNGNLDMLAGGTGDSYFGGTFSVSSGKWYYECLINAVGTGGTSILIGICKTSAPNGVNIGSYRSTSEIYNLDGTAQTAGATYAAGDTIGVAIDIDAGTVKFYKNNTGQGATPSFTFTAGTEVFVRGRSDSANPSATFNFGQRAFTYTAPSGFKALCTQNLPTPTIGATSTTLAGKYFNPVLYTGTGSSLSVTGVGFQPDWTWIKSRSNALSHGLYDAVRGVQKQLITNTTAAETTETTGLTAFGSDGFTTGALAQLNTSSATYVAWNWKANGSGSTNTAGQITSTVSANTTSGFSIVTFTTDGTTKTVGHGLGVKPSLVIVKVRNGAGSWIVMTDIINGSMQYGALNSTAAFASIGYSAPTSTVFQYNDNNGNTQVAYCFAEVAGYSKFGSYTGNGSADGTFVYTGFRPAYVMVKRTTGAFDWWIMDATRSPANAVRARLYANDSAAESSNDDRLDLLSNGFKFRNNDGGYNASGEPYIYMAFASNPFKYSLAR